MPRKRPAKRPWRDRAGRLSMLKLVVFVALFMPAAVLAVQLTTDDLGARPLNSLIHWTGLWTIRLTLLSLAITPARLLLAWPSLPVVRRMVGVAAMVYGLVHLTFYVIDQNGHLLHVGAEIIHRFYLTIGFVALLGVMALGVTSTDAAVRRMGKRWRQLHRLIYGIALLAVFHAALQSKANVGESILMSGLLVWLLLWRLLPAGAQRQWAALLALSAAACCATAGIEYAWYDLATHIPPSRVFAANFDIDWADGLRPAHWVFLTTLALAFAAFFGDKRRSVARPA